MAKIPKIVIETLEKIENKIVQLNDLNEQVDLKFKYYTNKIEKLDQLEREIRENKKDFENKIRNTQNQNIQTLSIFVAVFGIIFGFVSFSVAPELNFVERFYLFLLLIIAMIGFIYLINKTLK